MIPIIKNMKTKLFWSKSKIEVIDADKIIDQILEEMIDKNIVEKKNEKYKLMVKDKQEANDDWETV